MQEMPLMPPRNDTHQLRRTKYSWHVVANGRHLLTITSRYKMQKNCAILYLEEQGRLVYPCQPPYHTPSRFCCWGYRRRSISVFSRLLCFFFSQGREVHKFHALPRSFLNPAWVQCASVGRKSRNQLVLCCYFWKPSCNPNSCSYVFYKLNDKQWGHVLRLVNVVRVGKGTSWRRQDMEWS